MACVPHVSGGIADIVLLVTILTICIAHVCVQGATRSAAAAVLKQNESCFAKVSVLAGC